MNRKLIITQIVILGVIGLILAGLLVGLTAGRVDRANWFSNIRIGTGEPEKVLDETVPGAGLKSIEFDLRSTDVDILEASGDDLRIVLYSTDKADANDLIIENDGHKVTVRQRARVVIFSLFHHQRLEISLPKSFSGDVVISDKSGDVTIRSGIQAAKAELTITSGNLKCERSFSAESAKIYVTSGNIRFTGVSAKAYNISSRSGNIWIDSLDGSGSVDTTSGNVTINGLTGEKHDIETTSGNVGINEFSGYGSIRATSGDINLDCVSITGDLDVDTRNGSINASLPKDLAFELTATCRSGNINGNFPMNYSGKTATATVGEAPRVKLTFETTSGNIEVTQK